MHLTDWWRLSIKKASNLFFLNISCSLLWPIHCPSVTIWQPPDLICNLQFLGHLAFVEKLFLLFGILRTILTSIKPDHNQLQLFLCSNCLDLDLTISSGDGSYSSVVILPAGYSASDKIKLWCSFSLSCFLIVSTVDRQLSTWQILAMQCHHITIFHI